MFAASSSSSSSSLSPPADQLVGTSIGPNRDDVDLVWVYKATKNGWSAMDFHAAVDRRGSAIVIAMSRSGKVFGGYNPLGWMSTDYYINSNSAFLWFRKRGGRSSSTVKLPILPGGEHRSLRLLDVRSELQRVGSGDGVVLSFERFVD